MSNMIKKMLTQRLIWAILISITVLLGLFIWIWTSPLISDIALELECMGEKGTIVEIKYQNFRSDKGRRRIIKGGDRFENFSFAVNPKKRKGSYLEFTGGKHIWIRKLSVLTFLNRWTVKEEALEELLNIDPASTVQRVSGKGVNVGLPFLLVSPRLRDQIDKMSESKRFYLIAALLFSTIVFLLIRSFTFVNIKRHCNSLSARSFLTVIFLIILIIPLVYPMLKEAPPLRISKEKRSQKPGSGLSQLELFESATTLRQRFRKRFLWRREFIKANSWIKVRLFHSSPSPKVVIGKAGWLYLGQENPRINPINYYRGVRPFSKTEVSQWALMLEQRYNWLKKRGIHYLFVVVPNKATIYPEFLPDSISPARPDTRLDQLLAYLRETRSNVPVLDMRDGLRKKKAGFQLYKKTDTHWTLFGSYFAVDLINRKLAEFGFDLTLPDVSDLNIRRRPWLGGDLSQMLLLQDTIYREDKWIFTSGFPPSSSGRLSGFKRPNIKPRVVENAKGRPGTLLVVHDSFGFKLRPFLNHQFSRTVYLRDWGLNFFPRLIRKEKPVLIIDEITERFLDGPVPINPEVLK